jgi:hypothetical protein
MGFLKRLAEFFKPAAGVAVDVAVGVGTAFLNAQTDLLKARVDKVMDGIDRPQDPAARAAVDAGVEAARQSLHTDVDLFRARVRAKLGV